MNNTLLIYNTAETMGVFWYIMVEMFTDKLLFFRYTNLLLNFGCCVFIALIVQQTADFLDWTVEGKGRVKITPEKA